MSPSPSHVPSPGVSPPIPPGNAVPVRVVVIGYGSSLRRDDGAGPRAAEAVESWALPGVQVRALTQLVPELAADLAEANLALFLDARASDGPDDLDTRMHRLEPATNPNSGAIGHAADPARLLALARYAFGAAPAEAWMVTIPAVDLGLGEELSSVAQRGVERALALVADRLRQAGLAVPQTTALAPRTP